MAVQARLPALALPRLEEQVRDGPRRVVVARLDQAAEGAMNRPVGPRGGLRRWRPFVSLIKELSTAPLDRCARSSQGRASPPAPMAFAEVRHCAGQSPRLRRFFFRRGAECSQFYIPSKSVSWPNEQEDDANQRRNGRTKSIHAKPYSKNRC